MAENNFDLIMQFTRVEWLLHRCHQQNHMHFGPMGDTRKGQGRVLAILKLQPEISQKELSYLLDMRPQSLGELLAKLERNGYITRTPSETDRRILNIKLTEEGTRATQSDEQEFSFDKLFECLSEEEQKNLSDYLSRIIETLETELGSEQAERDFDPRMHGENPFDHHFRGHNNKECGRGYSAEQYDPRFERGRQHAGNIPFERRPEDMRFGHRRGMGRGSQRHTEPPRNDFRKE